MPYPTDGSNFEDGMVETLATVRPGELDIRLDCIDIADIGQALESTPKLGWLPKAINTVYDYNLLRQTLAFLKGFSSGDIGPEERVKLAKRLRESGHLRDEIRRMIVIINKQDDDFKSEAIGKCYKALVVEDITYVEFRELVEFVQRMYLGDADILFKVRGGLEEVPKDSDDVYRFERLHAIGGVAFEKNTFDRWDENGTVDNAHVEMAPLGRLYCDVVGQSDFYYEIELIKAQ